MKPVQKLVTLAAAGLFGAFLVTPSAAQQPKRPESTLTITERTEVPGGVILEPGTYAVKIADNQSSWNVVKITNADETKTFATVLTTPHTATDSAPHTLFVFYTAPSGEPKALRSWWPPNDRWGQDFVYSKQRGEELARLSNEKVPEMTADMEKAVPPSDQTTTAETAQTTTPESTTAQQTAPPPASDTGSTWKTEKMDTTASATNTETQPEPQPTTTTAENTTTRNELPRTASSYPLLALAGGAALALGFAVRRLAA